jgi:hypothetical protein
MAELDKVGFTSQTSRVRVGVKFMKNLGNFENVTLDFAFEEDARTGETLEQAEERLWELANATLAKRLKEILSDRDRSKRGRNE